MAVTANFTRNNSSFDNSTYSEFVTASLGGTYATGGFTWNPFNIYGGQGSSPIASTNLLLAQFFSPLGYIYVTTVSGNTATTKILTAPNTEFTNGTGVPDATVQVILRKRKM